MLNLEVFLRAAGQGLVTFCVDPKQWLDFKESFVQKGIEASKNVGEEEFPNFSHHLTLVNIIRTEPKNSLKFALKSTQLSHFLNCAPEPQSSNSWAAREAHVEFNGSNSFTIQTEPLLEMETVS